MSWLTKKAIPIKEYNAKKITPSSSIPAAGDSAVKPIQHWVRTK